METAATNRPQLTELDIAKIREFVARVLDNCKTDRIGKDAAAGRLANVMVALGRGDLEEARLGYEEGSSLGHEY